MVNTKEIPPEAILLGVYLELQNGWCSALRSLRPRVTWTTTLSEKFHFYIFATIKYTFYVI